jgi:uncharacterized protein YbjT (DUF2867 family)
MERKAIVVGASGLIGESLLKLLLTDSNYSQVLILVRKPLNIQHEKLQELVVNFDDLSVYAEQIKGDVVFSCLGTTKRKTPDQSVYKKIDYQYPLDVGWIAHNNGAESFHLISSIGANANSSIFYTRMKGELERELKAIPFKSIYIYQPSLLVGQRKENRLMEKVMMFVMRVLNPLLSGSLKKYKSIRVETIASAMVKESLSGKKGIYVYSSDQIENLGR